MLSKKFKKISIYADFRALSCYNKNMRNEAYTEEKLNNLPKEALAFLVLQQSESIEILKKNSETIQKQNEQLIKQIEDLREQVAILTAQRFGRSSEKKSADSGTDDSGYGNRNCIQRGRASGGAADRR